MVAAERPFPLTARCVCDKSIPNVIKHPEHRPQNGHSLNGGSQMPDPVSRRSLLAALQLLPVASVLRPWIASASADTQALRYTSFTVPNTYLKYFRPLSGQTALIRDQQALRMLGRWLTKGVRL